MIRVVETDFKVASSRIAAWASVCSCGKLQPFTGIVRPFPCCLVWPCSVENGGRMAAEWQQPPAKANCRGSLPWTGLEPYQVNFVSFLSRPCLANTGFPWAFFFVNLFLQSVRGSVSWKVRNIRCSSGGEQKQLIPNYDRFPDPYIKGHVGLEFPC